MNDDEFLNDRDCTPKGETPRTDAILEAQYGTLATLSRLEDHARELERELARLAKENDYLRASLANSGGPCAYCNLPKDKWVECARGFPGCARGDDAMLCPHVGADIEASEQLARALRVVEAALDVSDGEHLPTGLRAAVEKWEAGR